MMKNESGPSSKATHRQLVNPTDQDGEIASEIISNSKNPELESI
jgi:hypothetical protein